MVIRMGDMILAEVVDSPRFDSPDKLLAYAGMSLPPANLGNLKTAVLT